MAGERGRGVYQIMDAARAVAALVVVVSHVIDLLIASEGSGAGPLGRALHFVAGYGHPAVIVFFVLSGFWITASVERRCGSADFWPDYLLDRLSRLYVVLVPALLVGGIADAIGIGLVHAPLYSGALGTESIKGVSLAGFAPPVLLANLAFLQGIRFPTFGSNGPLWSLAFEFWFYIWLPAVRVSIRRRRPSPALAAFLLIGVYPRLLLGFACWLCGALLYWAGRRVGPADRRSAWLVLLGGLSATAVMLGLAGLSANRWLDPALALAFAALLLGLLMVDPVPAERGPLARLGRYGAGSSFSLYAMHYPFAALLIGSLVGHDRWPPSVTSVAAAIAIAGLLALVASGFSRLTEARTGAVREAVRRRLRPTAPA